METYLCKFDDLVTKVKSTWGKLEDDLLASLLLFSLLESYNIVVNVMGIDQSSKAFVSTAKTQISGSNIGYGKKGYSNKPKKRDSKAWKKKQTHLLKIKQNM